MRHYDWIKQTEFAALLTMPDALFDQVLRKIADSASSEDSEKTARFIREMVRDFHAAGGNVVVLSPSDQDVFASIDLSPVMPGDLFLPHQCVYFDMAGSGKRLCYRLHESDRQYAPLMGAYVRRVPATDYVSREDADGLAVWLIDLWGATGRSWLESGELKVPLILSDGMGSMEDAVVKFLDMHRSLSNVAIDAAFDTNVDTLRFATRVIINAILYWTSPEAKTLVDPGAAKAQQLWRDMSRVRSPGRRKEIQRRLDAISHVKITRFNIGTPPHAASERSAARRHKVAAHWSHYWVAQGHPLFDKGTNETDGHRRIRRLVAEHWRGQTSAGRVVSRIHEIG